MIRRTLARRLRDDAGTTVIELVIASGIFLIVLIAVLNLLDTATKAERGQQARHDAMLSLRNSMTRITKDIRQAVSIDTASTQARLDVQTLVSGVQHHIVYQIAGSQLTRTLDGGTAVPMAIKMTPTSQFCYDPPSCTDANPAAKPTTVRITVGLEPEVLSGGPITLATEVELRNLGA